MKKTLLCFTLASVSTTFCHAADAIHQDALGVSLDTAKGVTRGG